MQGMGGKINTKVARTTSKEGRSGETRQGRGWVVVKVTGQKGLLDGGGTDADGDIITTTGRWQRGEGDYRRLPFLLFLTIQDFKTLFFVLRGKENLAVTRMTNTNIHIGPDTNARPPPPLLPSSSPPPPPPPHTHTHTQACIMPVYRREDISPPYHRLRSA